MEGITRDVSLHFLKRGADSLIDEKCFIDNIFLNILVQRGLHLTFLSVSTLKTFMYHNLNHTVNDIHSRAWDPRIMAKKLLDYKILITAGTQW